MAVTTIAMAVVSCSLRNEDVVYDGELKTIKCVVPSFEAEEDFATGRLDPVVRTKATLSATSFLWSKGDLVGIIPDKGSQIYFEVDKGAGTSSASFDGGAWALKASNTYWSYYPFYPDIFLNKSHVPVSFVGQKQNGNNSLAHTGDYWCLYSGATTTTTNTLTFSYHHLTSLFKTYVTLPAGTYTNVTFKADDDIFIEEGYFDLSEEAPVIIPQKVTNHISLDLENVVFSSETELIAQIVVAPVEIANVPVTVSITASDGSLYEYTLAKANNMVASKTYAFRATDLERIVSDEAGANDAFANGATSIRFTEAPGSDISLILPATNDSTAIVFPSNESSSTISLVYNNGDSSAEPDKVYIKAPTNSNIIINTPNSTVTLGEGSLHRVQSSTSTNTLIIPEDTYINTLDIRKGSVVVYGHVDQIITDEMTDKANAVITVYGSVDVVNGEDDVTIVYPNRHETNYVDLGLSVKWATYNVGSETPEGSGYYYAWAETEPKSTYGWDNYKYSSGTNTSIFKYCTSANYGTIDNKTILESADDAATAVCGESWRTPTKAEFDELIKKCSSSWETLNGVSGMRFTASNGNSIFIPGAGRMTSGSTTPTGSNAYLWTSTKHSDSHGAESVLLSSSAKTIGGAQRYNGYQIRPVFVEDATAGITGVTLDKTELTLDENSTYTLKASIESSANAVNKYIEWTSSDPTVATVSSSGLVTAISSGTSTITCRTVFGGFESKCQVSVTFVPTYVDLGLSVKWATSNLGATREEGFGDYFAWGETAPKGNYSWPTYILSNGSQTSLTKYCTDSSYGIVDNLINLKPSDDAATVSWGESWRIPTDAEWTELRNNCTWTWSRHNNVDGYEVTSKKAGYTDKSIFIPAAGYRNNTSLYTSDGAGYYWSSSLCTDPHFAYRMHFDINGKYRSTNARYAGRSIRPVYSEDEKAGVTGISLSDSKAYLKVGTSMAITASVSANANAVNKYVEWSSSNPAVATVSYDGVITAIAAGYANIKAKTVFGGFESQCKVEVASEQDYGINLSEKGTANCYIVNEYGPCKFDATKKGHTNESVGAMASVEVLWESFGTDVQPEVGDIVKNVSINNGIIKFTASGKDGNAVIAAKDASGDILWSWHIWVCQGFDPDATAQEYYNNSGIVMDRNLGATSAAKGDVKALGLLYQWGRKDPFLGGQSISSSTCAKSTITWPYAVYSNSSNGTIDYVVKHPTTFVMLNYDNYEWYYTGSSSTDDTRWKSDKGMYDPCPSGWRVPDGGENGLWVKGFGTGSLLNSSSNWDTNRGMDFGNTYKTLGSGTIWYPASGSIDYSNGLLNNVGSSGSYWSCTPNGSKAYYMSFEINGNVSPLDDRDIGRGYGKSVRCVKE